VIDEEALTAATKKAEEIGLKVFNIFQLSEDETDHCRILIDLMSVKGRGLALDVGSGVGHFSGLLAEAYPDLSVFALNDNAYQLSLTPERCSRILSDMHSIEVRDGSFDLVVCSYTMGFARISEFLREMRRVLADDGVFWIYDMAGRSPIMKRLLHYNVYTVGEFEVLANEAGLKVEKATLPIANTKNFSRLLLHETPEARALVNIALNQVEPVLYKLTRKS
jgi:ubiquinone/menaquinone biosynthesis C-methylase UbiE